MAPYLGLAALVAILASLGDFVHRSFAAQRLRAGVAVPERRLFRGYFDWVAVAALVAFSALRFNVGTDYPVYYTIYENIDTRDWATAIAEAPQEIGFTAMMLALKALTDSPYAIFWAAAVLTVIPIYAALTRMSASPALAITLYVLMAYATSFNLVRQSIAAAILFWAWGFLGRKNRWFLALAVLAATFHASAIFAAVIMLVARRSRFSAKTVVATAAVAVVAAIALRSAAVTQGLAAINPRYVGYLSSGETGTGAYLQIAALVALLVFATAIGTRNRPLSDLEKQWALLATIGIVFMLAGTQAIIVFRMGGYFTLFLLVLVSNRIAKSNEALLSSALILTGATAYYIGHLSNYGDAVPYETYLSVP